MTDGHFEGSFTEKKAHHKSTQEGRSRVTIDMVPDVALLSIFDFYLDKARNGWFLRKAWTHAWHPLVHVCRKWRIVAFGSPRRLDLRLYCTADTPVREMLDIWPSLPVVVKGDGHKEWGMDNIFAALAHQDRIFSFELQSSMLKNVLAKMQQPFPALTYLELKNERKAPPFIPPSFLGGSSPNLYLLRLCYIRFPGLPKLLLSATHLTYLCLWEMPHRGHISPEAMATCLSLSTRLESVIFTLKSRRSRPKPGTRRPPPQTRTLVPVLTHLEFKGANEYLEDLVARIDTPLLDHMYIAFFRQLILDTSQLAQFIIRTPKFNALHEATMVFSNQDVSVTLPQTSSGRFQVEILPIWPPH